MASRLKARLICLPIDIIRNLSGVNVCTVSCLKEPKAKPKRSPDSESMQQQKKLDALLPVGGRKSHLGRPSKYSKEVILQAIELKRKGLSYHQIGLFLNISNLNYLRQLIPKHERRLEQARISHFNLDIHEEDM